MIACGGFLRSGSGLGSEYPEIRPSFRSRRGGEGRKKPGAGDEIPGKKPGESGPGGKPGSIGGSIPDAPETLPVRIWKTECETGEGEGAVRRLSSRGGRRKCLFLAEGDTVAQSDQRQNTPRTRCRRPCGNRSLQFPGRPFPVPREEIFSKLGSQDGPRGGFPPHHGAGK